MPYIETNGYFTFDDVKSSDYGVWINGGGTYNAPKRRYKTYEVPGRNGNLTIDEGAFEEQEVIYPAFIARDFPSNIEAFRNELMSRNGYVRMTDSFHPGEYYLARYMDGLEADVAPGGVGGAFNLKFMRDPRRFLVEGDIAIPYPPGIESSRNLLKYPYYNTSKTQYDIEWQDLGDGRIYAKGTASGMTSFYCSYSSASYPLYLPKGEYFLSGCPADSTGSDYRIQLRQILNGSTTTVGYDTGSGLEFTVTDIDAVYRVSLEVFQEYGDVLFCPMIQSKNKNLLYPYSDSDKTASDISFTLGDVGKVIASGTATDTAAFDVKSQTDALELPAGTYTLTGCPANGSDSTYRIAVRRYNASGSSSVVIGSDIGSGYTLTVSESDVESGYKYAFIIFVYSGQTVNDLIFTPQLLIPQEIDPAWVRYYSSNAVVNNTKYTARPLIRVTGYGNFYIGSDSITIESGQSYVDIDSETQDCYTGTENKNSKVTFQSNNFPTFAPGITNISYSGNITKIEITPRWWKI